MTTNPQTLSRAERRKRGWRSKKAVALLLTGLVVASGSAGTATAILGVTAAEAATSYVGFYDGIGVGMGSLRHSDGSIVYCLEYGHAAPDGTDAGFTNATSLPGYNYQGFMNAKLGISGASGSVAALSGAKINQLKYILGHWGQTSDPIQATAVQLAIWDLRTNGSTGTYAGDMAHIKSVLSANGYGAAVTKAAAYRAEATSATAGGNASVKPGEPIITVTGPYAGNAAVKAGTTQITVDNGKFTAQAGVSLANGGKTANITDGAAHTIKWTGQPPEGYEFGRYYRVTFNGKYAYEVPGALQIAARGGIDQTLGKGSAPAKKTGNFAAHYVDPDTIWSPVLTTNTPAKFMKKGELPRDTINFTVAKGSKAWRQSFKGTEKLYAPIKAKGTYYGPFKEDPALNPQAGAPADAPIAATATVTTDTKKGPGAYEVKGDKPIPAAGYYTWVWEIDYKDQLASVTNPKPNGVVQAPSIPEKYFFADGFGDKNEGIIAPADIKFTTQLLREGKPTETAPISNSITDEILPSTEDIWLETNGAPTKFKLRGTAYLTAEKPEQQKDVPADAKKLSETFVTISKNGEKVVSDPIDIPTAPDGKFVTVQWCLLNSDQDKDAAGKATDFCDDFGVPTETAEIVKPEVTTKAQDLGAVKGDVSDTANVKGVLPDSSKYDTEIDFTAYLKPEVGQPKYDENWKPVVDESGKPVLWTQDEVNDPEAVCEAQPVGRTDRVKVDKEGDYQSPTIKAETPGTLYWVEELHVKPKDSDKPEDDKVVHRGKCGLPNETTKIEYPKVTTKAVTEGTTGETGIFDTAIVTGPLSERDDIRYEVTFEAYHRAEGETTKVDESLCTPDTKVWESTKPVNVTKAGEYKSESWKTTEKHLGEILWVETLTQIEKTDQGEKKSEIHRGKCGEKNEITKVKLPLLVKAANTASDLAVPISIGAGILLLGGAAAAIFMVRRRKVNASADTSTE